MAQIKLKEDTLKFIELSLQKMKLLDSTEAKISHTYIAAILNDLFLQSNGKIDYRANKTNEAGDRPDFVITNDEHEFFIIEAKADGFNVKKTQEQLQRYFLTHETCNYGFLTTGRDWIAFEAIRTFEAVELVQRQTFFVNQPQLIADYITDHILF